MNDSPLHAHVQNAAPDAQRADQLLTVADVAGRIGAHEQTVCGWITTGELKVARFGTRIGYRIRLGDYEDFLHRRTLTGAIAAHLLRGASTAPDARAAPALNASIGPARRYTRRRAAVDPRVGRARTGGHAA